MIMIQPVLCDNSPVLDSSTLIVRVSQFRQQGPGPAKSCVDHPIISYASSIAYRRDGAPSSWCTHGYNLQQHTVCHASLLFLSAGAMMTACCILLQLLQCWCSFTHVVNQVDDSVVRGDVGLQGQVNDQGADVQRCDPVFIIPSQCCCAAVIAMAPSALLLYVKTLAHWLETGQILLP
jgi:hypothetical protein